MVVAVERRAGTAEKVLAVVARQARTARPTLVATNCRNAATVAAAADGTDVFSQNVVDYVQHVGHDQAVGARVRFTEDGG